MAERRRAVAGGLLVLLCLFAVAAATQAGAYSLRPGGGDQQQGAVLRAGQVYAEPLADPRALLVLDADNVLVTDGALGFVVGVGPQFGPPDENGLAARQPLAQGLPEPHEITISGGQILVTTRGDGGVVAFDLGTGEVTPLVQGIAAPRAVAAVPGGVAVVDEGSAVVIASTDPAAERLVVPIDDPRGLAAGDQVLWTCANGADEVVAIDVATGEVVPLLPLPDPTNVVALPVGAPAEQVDALLVESAGSDVLVVDPVSGAAVPVPEFADGIPPLADGFSLPPPTPAPQESPADEPSDAATSEVLEDPPAVGSDDEPADMGDTGDADDAGATDAAVPTDADGLPWWLWVLLVLLPFLGAAGWGVVRGRARQSGLVDGEAPGSDPPPSVTVADPVPDGGPIEDRGLAVDVEADDDLTLPGVGSSIDLAPQDPCEDLRTRCRTARRRCEEATAACDRAITEADQAEQAARTAADAAGDARAELDAARAAAAAAQRALDGANERPEEGSSVTDDQGRITQRDLGLKRAASKAAWGRYQAGEITAGQLEAEWESLGERDAIDRLQEQDEARRGERVAEAEAAKAAADAALVAATTAAAAADAAAAAAAEAATAAATARDEACASAATACDEAERICAELAECERREEEQRAAAAAAAAAAAKEEAARREEPPPETPPSPTSGGRGGAKPPCCPDCTWVGYGYMTAGMSLFAGIEYTTIHLHCASDPSIWITIECQTLRLGLGLGGEGAAVGAVAFGCSPTDAVTSIRSALNGTNGDISLGVPATKLAMQAGKSGDVAKALKLLRRLGKKQVPPTKLPTPDLAGIKQAGDALKGSLQGTAKAGAIQTANQSGVVQGLVLPLGAGLQVGLWRGVSTKIWVTGSNLPPGCVGPPGYSRG